MHSHLFVRCAFALVFGLTAFTAEAEEVTLKHEGLTLNADFALAEGKKPADGVILITHGSLAHRDMETIATLRELLNERGYSTLAINLSLGLDNRHGMYDCKRPHRHRNGDAVEEIGVWMNWLKGQGATRVALMGHSRGGLQTALTATDRDNAQVKAVVLLAPATSEYANAHGYKRRYDKELTPVLEKAQKLVKDGKGETMLEHANLLSCRDTTVTAESFVSYYGADQRLDTPSLIPKFKKPALVVVGSEDKVVVDLEKKVAPLADGKKVRMAVIDGASHFFRDLYAEDVADEIESFLEDVGF